MKKIVVCFIACVMLTACHTTTHQDFMVTVQNDLAFDRHEEMVQVPISAIAEHLQPVGQEKYVVLDADSTPVPYQITYDHQLLFPVNVKAQGKSSYSITVGQTEEITPVVYGHHYPERLDDIAWENNRIAFRTYGPALQKSGERAYGYDVWVKNIPTLVVEQRYANELNPEKQTEIAQLRKKHKYEEANELYHSISYHVDHGDGLDCYKVGPTLGAGTSALLNKEGKIVYPYCWQQYEILENGPFRFTVKLTYSPLTVDDNENVIETRIISLDMNSHLNKTIVSYSGLKKDTPIATGIVTHPTRPTSYTIAEDRRYIAYADPTDNIHNDNGTIYIGAVFPKIPQETKVVFFGDKEKKVRPGSSGHVLAISNYKPDSEYTYYWGAGWSKFGFGSEDEWNTYLDKFAQRLKSPLKVSYE